MLHVKFLVTVFVVFSCIDEIRATCPKPPSLNDKLKVDTKLWGYSIYEIPILSLYQCVDACLRETRCKSFNFKRKQKDEDKALCELNDTQWSSDINIILEKKTGWDYYDVGFEGLREVSKMQNLIL